MYEFILLIFLLVITSAFLIFYFSKQKKKNNLFENSVKNYKESITNEEVTPQKEEELNIDLPLTINHADQSNLKHGNIIEANDKLTEYSNDLLRVAKTTMPHMPGGKEVYEVVFSESIQKELKNGTTKLMDSLKKEGYQRAMAVNEKGKIIEHANLKVQKYNPAQLKSLAINTLTVVVSQEHLQEIRKELEKIRISLDRLISMRKNEYYGKAKGSYDYLKRAYTIYQNNEISEKVMVQLESIYRENVSSIYSIIKDLEDVTTQVSILKKKVWMWQTKEQLTIVSKIVKEYNDYENLLNLYFMNVTGCIKLMELYGDSQAVINHAIENSNELIKLIEKNKMQVLVELDTYASEYKTKFTTDNYMLEKQKSIKKEINKVNSISSHFIKKSLSDPPEKLYLSVENSEVVAVYKA